MKKMIFPLLIAVFVFALPVSSYAISNEKCFSCHGEKGSKYYVDSLLFYASAHNGLTCTSCHVNIGNYPHKDTTRVKCVTCHFKMKKGYRNMIHNQAFSTGKKLPYCITCHGYHYVLPADHKNARERIPSLCSQCHVNAYKEYKKGIHGILFLERHNDAAAVCSDCHFVHSLPSVGNKKWKLALIKECGNCHRQQMDTYNDTVHGEITRLGYTFAAECPDCHGAHKILPPRYEESTLSPRKIVNTCKKCHPYANPKFAEFHPHAEPQDKKDYPFIYYTDLFMKVLMIGVFSFFFLHTLLWAYRSLRENEAKRKKGGS